MRFMETRMLNKTKYCSRFKRSNPINYRFSDTPWIVLWPVFLFKGIFIELHLVEFT